MTLSDILNIIPAYYDTSFGSNNYKQVDCEVDWFFDIKQVFDGVTYIQDYRNLSGEGCTTLAKDFGFSRVAMTDQQVINKVSYIESGMAHSINGYNSILQAMFTIPNIVSARIINRSRLTYMPVMDGSGPMDGSVHMGGNLNFFKRRAFDVQIVMPGATPMDGSKKMDGTAVMNGENLSTAEVAQAQDIINLMHAVGIGGTINLLY